MIPPKYSAIDQRFSKANKLGPVVQSLISANPGLTLLVLLRVNPGLALIGL